MSGGWLMPFVSRRSLNPWSWDSGYSDLGQAMRVMNQEMQSMQRDMDRMSQGFACMSPSCREFRTHEHESLNNPFVVDKDGSKTFQLRFDVRHFKPEEVKIRTKDGCLEVEAKHEDKSENNHVVRQYQRCLTIPDQVDPQTMKSTLSPEGVLVIEAPLREAIDAPPKETPMQITHE